MVRSTLIATAVVIATVAAATAVAAEEQDKIHILEAEVSFEASTVDQINVKGNGLCGAPGLVTIRGTLRDLQTNGTAIGSMTVQCFSAGEHVQWLLRLLGVGSRPGDRVLVSVTATGAISDADEKELMLQTTP